MAERQGKEGRDFEKSSHALKASEIKIKSGRAALADTPSRRCVRAAGHAPPTPSLTLGRLGFRAIFC